MCGSIQKKSQKIGQNDHTGVFFFDLAIGQAEQRTPALMRLPWGACTIRLLCFSDGRCTSPSQGDEHLARQTRNHGHQLFGCDINLRASATDAMLEKTAAAMRVSICFMIETQSLTTSKGCQVSSTPHLQSSVSSLGSGCCRFNRCCFLRFVRLFRLMFWFGAGINWSRCGLVSFGS